MQRTFLKAALLVIFISAFTVCSDDKQNQNHGKADSTLRWKEGFLDIHHINTGRGNAAFFIFPDGTTMLFDAGDIDIETFKKLAPLKVSPVHPSDSLTPGGWIARYIKHIFSDGRKLQIDYAVISHFHGDHYGSATSNSKWSASGGNYKLTGITEVGEYIPIGKILDRGYPDYIHPLHLKKYYRSDSTFSNYLSFLEYQVNTNKMEVEMLEAGRNDQIILKYDAQSFPSFQIRNIKSNHELWNGKDQETITLFDPDDMVDDKGKFNENPLSLALKVSYGDFDYFTGGDNTGLQGPGIPPWFDVETPMAKVVGSVDVLTLNHHGNRDASNEFFLKTLSPRVVVQQSWCSDHPGMEVFHRLAADSLYENLPDIFATNIHEETKTTYGPWFVNGYKAMQGHIMIRVLTGGDKFYVYSIGDETFPLKVLQSFGPYLSE